MKDPNEWPEGLEDARTLRELVASLPRPENPTPEKEAALAEQLARVGPPLPAAAPAAASGGSLTLGAVVAAGLLGIAALTVWRSTKTPNPSPPHAPTSQKVAPLAAQVSSAEPSREPSSAPSEAPPTTSVDSSRTKSRGLTSSDSLAEEERLLERARSAAAPEDALRALRDHERRFPSGQLALERMYLLVGTYKKLGNAAAAQAAARQVQRTHPESVYARRLAEPPNPRPSSSTH